MAAIGPVTGPSSGGMRWIFRPTSARWVCRKGWPGPSRRHCPRPTATPTPCAGALGVQLAGPAYYFGQYYPKLTIGDTLRPIEPEDILRANRMMYVASSFALAWGCALRALF